MGNNRSSSNISEENCPQTATKNRTKFWNKKWASRDVANKGKRNVGLRWMVGGSSGAGSSNVCQYKSGYRHSIAYPLEAHNNGQQPTDEEEEEAPEWQGRPNNNSNGKNGAKATMMSGEKMRMRKSKSEKFTSTVFDATLNLSNELALMEEHQGDNDSLDEYALCATTTAHNNNNKEVANGRSEKAGTTTQTRTTTAMMMSRQHRRPSSSGDGGGEGVGAEALDSSNVDNNNDDVATAECITYKRARGAGRKAAATATTTKSKSFRQIRTIAPFTRTTTIGGGAASCSLCRQTGLSQIQKRLILSRWHQMSSDGDELYRLCENAFQKVFQQISGNLARAILKLNALNDHHRHHHCVQQKQQDEQPTTTTFDDAHSATSSTTDHSNNRRCHLIARRRSSLSASSLHHQRAFRLHVQRFCLVLTTLLDNLMMMEEEMTALLVEQLAMEYGTKLAAIVDDSDDTNDDVNSSNNNSNEEDDQHYHTAVREQSQQKTNNNRISPDFWNFLILELVRSGIQNRQQDNVVANLQHQQQVVVYHQRRRSSLLLANSTWALFPSRRSAEAWMLLCTYVVTKIRFGYEMELFLKERLNVHCSQQNENRNNIIGLSLI